MTEYVCAQFEIAIDLLKETFCSPDKVELKGFIDEAIIALENTYAPLKDQVYYANLICKELYCKVRGKRDHAIELLNCALKVLADAGGDTGCCKFSEADVIIREALMYIKEARDLLCKCCDLDSCNSSCSYNAFDSCSSSNSCDSSNSCCSDSSCSKCSSSSSCSDSSCSSDSSCPSSCSSDSSCSSSCSSDSSCSSSCSSDSSCSSSCSSDSSCSSSSSCSDSKCSSSSCSDSSCSKC